MTSSELPPAGQDRNAPSPHRTLQPPDWPPPKGYAHGLMADGRLVVTGGVVGWTAQGTLAATFIAQARQCLLNIVAILHEAGAGPEHLVRLTWYVTDIDEYLSHPKELSAAYTEVFGGHDPAMTAVQVNRLVEYAAKVQIEATAVLPAVR